MRNQYQFRKRFHMAGIIDCYSYQEGASMTDIVPQPQVQWDLGDLFSGIDDPKIPQTLEAAKKRAEQFQVEYKGTINSIELSAGRLLEAIVEYEAIELQATKPIAYASLLYSTDTSDPARGAFLQKMREQATALSMPTMFFTLELAAAPQEILDRILESDEIAPYRHYIRNVRTSSPHLLTEPEEVILEETANTGVRAWTRLYEETTSNAVFVVDGEELTQSQVLARLYSPDREVRRKAAAGFTEGLNAISKPVAFIYNTLLQDKNVRDRLRKYTYPEEARHLSNELPKQTVDLVVDTVAQNYGIVARYYETKRQILGLDELSHYDRYAPLFHSDETVEFDRAREIVLSAFGEFSDTMRERADEFFERNWIDAAPVKGKQGGAYCSYITPDLHPYVFMNYMGKMKDVMTLAHELGHGVHSSLSRGQSYFNYHGTLPLAELASTFGEMLVFERVIAEASLQDKLALYAEKIEGAFATIPRQTALYRFEQAIHRHRREKGELGLEDFGNYWQQEGQAMFGSSISLGDDHKIWWSYVRHFVRTPFYVYAYSFGELLALSLYRRSQREGQQFADRYLDMLRAGGSMSPQELMSMVGTNLDDPQFWQGGFDVLTGLVARFEELWKEYSAPRNSE